MDLTEADLRLWATYQAVSHTPREGARGESCDEMGCAICNLVLDEYVERYVEAVTAPRYDPYAWHPATPDESEMAEAKAELRAGRHLALQSYLMEFEPGCPMEDYAQGATAIIETLAEAGFAIVPGAIDPLAVPRESDNRAMENFDA